MQNGINDAPTLGERLTDYQETLVSSMT